MDVYMAAAIASVVAKQGEMAGDARRLREAKTPQQALAVLSHMRERDDHRKALEVARASAPQVTVINRNYCW